MARQQRLAVDAQEAASGTLYYWYAGPAIKHQLVASAWVGPGIRSVGIGLVASWLIRTLARSGVGTAAEGNSWGGIRPARPARAGAADSG